MATSNGFSLQLASVEEGLGDTITICPSLFFGLGVGGTTSRVSLVAICHLSPSLPPLSPPLKSTTVIHFEPPALDILNLLPT